MRGTVTVTVPLAPLRTCFAYDGLGRKISETSPNGTADLSWCPYTGPPTTTLPYTTSLRYDSDGRVTGTISPDPDGSGPLPHPAVRNSYDAAGRLIRVEQGALFGWQPEGVAPALWPGFNVVSHVDSSFDALDRKTREAASGAGVTEYGYDLAGRLKCTAVRMNPDVWSTALPDKCVPGPPHSVHGYDRISMTVYDKAGRATETWEGVGTPFQRREAHYTYNFNGRKTSLTDARGFRAEMIYDGHDRQMRWVFPSKTTPGVANPLDYEHYLYDPNGNRTLLRKRDEWVMTFQYDVLNRMTAKLIPERPGLTAAQTRDVYYGYDLRGLQTEARFDSLAGEGVSNAFDGFGRLASTTTNMGGASRTVSHRYDREGREVETSFPDGQKFWTSRDGLGRMIGSYHGPLGDTSTGLTVFHYSWTSDLYYFGRRWGSATLYEKDSAGRLTKLDQYFNTAPGNNQSSFTYNPASQLRSETRTNDAYAWKDAVAVDRPYSVNGQNQYTAVGGAAFAYDFDGNLVSDGLTEFGYDAENRLVSAAYSKTASLVYDPLGRLFQISSPSTGITRFLYDGDALVAEYDGAGTLLRRYIHGDGSDDPLYWFEGSGLGQPRFPHADRQGSIIATAEPGGTLMAINTYDEYGIPGADQRPASALGRHGRFQYTGQAWLPELGMYYYKARIYSPTLGRFLQVDPIGYDDQVNLYVYVGNDPVNGTDTTGMQGCSDAGKDAQAALAGTCVDSSKYKESKGSNRTVVSTPEIDASARSNMPSIANDRGPGENIVQFDQQGSNVVFTPLSTTTTEGNATLQGRATPIGTPDAIGHSHPDLKNRQPNISPGYENRRIGDHVQVNAGRPNYITNSGMTIVIERSQGQFRARVITGSPTRGQLRSVRSQLNRLQKGSRQ